MNPPNFFRKGRLKDEIRNIRIVSYITFSSLEALSFTIKDYHQ